MAWSVVQSHSGTATSATSLTVTYASNVASGNKLIAAFSQNNASSNITSVQDAALNSWTQLAVASGGSGATKECTALYALDVPAGDAGTQVAIKVTFAASASSSMLIQEVSGLLAGNTTAMLDGAATTKNQVSTASVTQPAYTSTAANEYLVSVFGDRGGAETYTAPAGYTADTNGVNNNSSGDVEIAYKNSTNGAESGTWTFTGTLVRAGWIVAAFQLAGAAVTPVPGSWAAAARRQPPRRPRGTLTAGILPPAAGGTAYTVTATQGGVTANGMALRVFVLTQAAATQNGATANAHITSATAFTASVTTTQAGSRVYGAAAPGNGSATLSAAALTTLADDVTDAVNGEHYGTFKATSLTGTPGATTLGVTSAVSTSGPVAMAEILTAGTLAEDGSGPVVANTTSATTVTTASFTPPAGSLLVALVASDGGSGVTTMTVSSSPALTWTELVKNNPSAGDYAGVWAAQVPGSAAAVPLGAGLTQAPRRQPPRRPRSSVTTGMLPGSGTVSYPAATAAAAAQWTTSPRRQSPRRPRSSITAGWQPPVIVPVFVQAERRPPARRPRSTLTAGTLVTAAAAAVLPAPPVTRAVRRQPPRRIPGRIATGMTPGAGTAFIPPPTPLVQAVRRQPPRRPRSAVSGPLTPGSGVAFVPPPTPVMSAVRRQPPRRPRGSVTGPLSPGAVPAAVLPAPPQLQARRVLRPAARRSRIAAGLAPVVIWPPPVTGRRPRPAAGRRGTLAGPLAPGVPPVTPVVPGPLRATRRPPAGVSRPVRLQRALAASSYVPPSFTIGALTASAAPLAVLTAATAGGAASGGVLTATDQRAGGPS